jgi:hypothetical protein
MMTLTLAGIAWLLCLAVFLEAIHRAPLIGPNLAYQWR